jgi:hypothetical protein
MKNPYLKIAHMGGFAFAVLALAISIGVWWQSRATTLTLKNTYSDGNPLTAAELNATSNTLMSWSTQLDNSNVAENADIDEDKLLLQGSGCGRATGVGCVDDADIFDVGVDKFTGLRCAAQATPDNTVLVAAGAYPASDGLSTKTYAGGTSPVFPNTGGAGINRIDVLTINDGGTLAITAGVEGPSPSVPNYPTGVVPLCEVYIRYNAAAIVIKDADDSTNSYIQQDARPIITPGVLADDSVTTTKIADDAVTPAKLWFDTGLDNIVSEQFIGTTPLDWTNLCGAGDYFDENEHVIDLSGSAIIGVDLDSAVTGRGTYRPDKISSKIIFESRVYFPTWANVRMTLGLWDTTISACQPVFTSSEMITLYRDDGNTDKISFYCCSGGSCETTNNLTFTWSTWHDVRIEIAGDDTQVEIFIDDVSLDTCTTAARIPDAVFLRPVYVHEFLAGGPHTIYVDWTKVYPETDFESGL